MSEHINLGDTVRDTITGFTGVVIAATEFRAKNARFYRQTRAFLDREEG